MNLSATYGMSGRTAGARLGKTAEEGEALLNKFFTDFSGVKTAIDQSKAFLKEHGYVEDFLGRRRSLPEINMDPYQAKMKYAGNSDVNFNPFLECTDRKLANDPADIWLQIMEQYIVLSNAARAASVLLERRKPEDERVPAKCTFEVKNEIPNKTFDKLNKIAQKPTYMADQSWIGKRTCAQKIAEDANAVKNILFNGEYSYYDYGTKQRIVVNVNELPEFKEVIKRYTSKYKNGVQTTIPKEPVILSAWTGKIAQASRQCFNSRIQGSAASLTKLAMVDIARDSQLQSWDAQLIIPVHDELLVECPAYYADKVEKRLPEVMINAAKEGGDNVPQACDPYNVSRWASDVMAATLLDEFKKLEHSGMTRDEAMSAMKEKHPEYPPQSIEDVLTGKTSEIIF